MANIYVNEMLNLTGEMKRPNALKQPATWSKHMDASWQTQKEETHHQNRDRWKCINNSSHRIDWHETTAGKYANSCTLNVGICDEITIAVEI
eukprot:scaffold5003_cov101-Skeletonema_dohrnii-CCMP3373.AAC.2